MAFLFAIALPLVHLRSEQGRLRARIMESESQWVVLRRDLFSAQVRTARFKSPARLRDRASIVAGELAAPGDERPLGGRDRIVVRDSRGANRHD